MTGARGFPAFPAVRGSGRFARTWWGREWISGLEDSALDEQQLRQGRRYARSGYVGPITVSAGRLSAQVRDYDDDTSYAPVLRVPELSADEWDRVAGQVAAESGHIAALLDGEMPAALASSAAEAGVALLPGIGDFDSECGCPGWEMPCRHAAAVAYQAAWLIDADPFVLLLVRGRTRDALLAGLASEDERAAGIPAALAFATPADPLPDPPGVPDEPATPLTVPAAPGVDSGIDPGIDPGGLALLAADAAVRARALLSGTVVELPLADDVVRFAATHFAATHFAAAHFTAAHSDSAHFAAVDSGAAHSGAVHSDTAHSGAAHRAAGDSGAAHSGAAHSGAGDSGAGAVHSAVVDRLRAVRADLDRAVAAWHQGGLPALRVLETSWRPPAAEVARARAALASVTDESAEVAANRVTVGDTQLRYGRDGRWYPYRVRDGDWWPAGTSGADAASALLSARAV
ncbi:SWIM zinc finger family protein [Actinokineospora sp. 24-640]